MTNLTLWQIEQYLWYALTLYWLVTAFRVKSTQASEPAASRLFTMAVVGLAFALLFSHYFQTGILGERFLTRNLAIERSGVALTFLGVALAIWARTILGANWSAEVTLKVDHQLIRSGPYAYVRHPIYTGMLLAFAGTAIVVGEWRGLLAIAVATAGLGLKARREEALMIHAFGDQYQQHRQTTGFLLPRL
ncbi:MAG TPA: isoprenylcysteine carboxylmethyltransferase family protein [Candidatus Sulfotelmatobacter sp.]|nr:isoprenylcysteine carboxylmethyltransferase family protein [Candidatus Sulfotelmatobacter sp.]